jgi:3-dehydroquinate dehydratase-2
MRLAVINGPNLNLLGEREPDVYGRMTLAELETTVAAYAAERDVEIAFFQSNSEGAIIDQLHRLRGWADGIVINPGAYTHYSYAIRDALAAIVPPAVEVHLSDISKREAFRQISVTSDACIAQISGLGLESYLRGIDRLVAHLSGSSANAAESTTN